MLNSVLANAVDKTRTVPIGEAALLALVGFSIVVLGIAFLIFVVWLVGKMMAKTNGQKAQSEVKPQPKPVVAPVVAPPPVAEEIPEETVAIITAAIMAYYEQTNPKCEFTVKRIKRI